MQQRCGRGRGLAVGRSVGACVVGPTRLTRADRSRSSASDISLFRRSHGRSNGDRSSLWTLLTYAKFYRPEGKEGLSRFVRIARITVATDRTCGHAVCCSWFEVNHGLALSAFDIKVRHILINGMVLLILLNLRITTQFHEHPQAWIIRARSLNAELTLQRNIFTQEGMAKVN